MRGRLSHLSLRTGRFCSIVWARGPYDSRARRRAAGGPIGGAIAGQALKGAAELIKGEKVSTAIGKGVKTAAIGALAGGVFNQISAGIDQLLPPEITNTFINDASGEIDITKLSGMSATSLDVIDADAASELIQSRTALAELAGQGNLGDEANKVLQDQISQLDDKIVALGAPDGGSVEKHNFAGEIIKVDIRKGWDFCIRRIDSLEIESRIGKLIHRIAGATVVIFNRE